MPDPHVRIGGHVLAWSMFALGIAIGLAVIRPFADAPVGFDTQATVAYFERLVAGRPLEQALSTTPKPLLTVVFGVLHAATDDWRPIVWATIAAQAAAGALAALLAARTAGLAAGVAAGGAVAGTTLLIEDSAFGNGVPWALFGWLLAACLLSGPRARPGLAGVVLALAALARLETLVIVLALGAALAWARYGPWPLPGPRPTVPGRVWLAVVVPFAALPIMLVHDWLLTGDALYWLSVSQRYSDIRRESLDILGPLERTTWFARRYVAIWPVIPLAVAGLAVLVRGRCWGVLVGLAGMGPGIAVFLVVLAARGLYAPHRYAIPVDIAVLLGAAIGLGWLIASVAERIGRTDRQRVAVTLGAFGLVVGGLVAVRAGPFDPELARVVGDVRTLNENAARVAPILGRSAPSPATADEPVWLVPSAVRPRIAVDLDVPLTAVGGLSLRWLDPARADYAVGQFVYHDRQGDLPRGGYVVLETDGVVRIGEATLEPRLADALAGAWVFEVTGTP